MNEVPVSQLTLWDKYGKAAIAFAYAVLAVVTTAWSGDHHVDASEGIIIALAIGNCLLVYVVPITRHSAGVKTLVNAIMAGLVVAQAQIAGGIDGNDWTLIIGAIVGGLGVAIAPAYSPKERVRVGMGSDTPIAV
jgi:hypothetical protein